MSLAVVVVGCLLLLLGHFAVESTKHLSNANNSSIFSIAKCSQLVAVVVIVVVNAKREKIATTTAATATPAAATVKYNNNSGRKNINLAGIFLAFLCPASSPTDL